MLDLATQSPRFMRKSTVRTEPAYSLELAPNMLMDFGMDTQIMVSARDKLLDRSLSLLSRRRRTLAEFDRIADSEARTLARIQASLDRIAQGTYGACVTCHGAIETERLRAIPEVDRCGGCTR